MLGKQTFEEWISPLELIGTKDNIAYVLSKDRKKYTWIKQNLLDKINKNVKPEFNLTLKLVSFEDSDEYPTLDEINNSENNKNSTCNSNLKLRYTFENFVQVDQNRMAYSFAHSVSEFPSKSYNPLYIYSDVGLGKTHLMNAIGNRILQNNKHMSVIYCTSSEFMNEYVEYNRLNKRTEFIRKYTTVDVLLIDDIQFITKWEGTSEQFYYIFNQLRELDKQIVLCSDKHPDYIPNLEHRIKSRFEWGAVVDILPYDLEGRMAILKSKLAERKIMLKNHFEIPEEILYYIASSIKDNVRKMEGALNRLIGYADLKFPDADSNKITLPFAKEALKPIISLSKKPVTIESIQEYIAKEFNVTKSDLVSKSNKRDHANPRQVAMYITKKLTKTPLHEIGIHFGGKHHSTVLHSINKVENQIEQDFEFARQIDNYIKFFEE